MSLRFRYKAVGYGNEIQKGVIEAEDMQSAKLSLDSRGFIPVSIKELPQTESIRRKLFKPSVNLEALSMFTQKLNTLYRAGIPILQSLAIIANEQENSEFSEVMFKIRNGIEGGMTLSQAMGQFPGYFPQLFISTIKAGESSGQMESILERLHELVEREKKTREMVKAAVRYPSYVLVVISLAIAVVVTVVVPKFADFYGFYKAELPLPTRILLNFSGFVVAYWYIVIAAVGLMLVSYIKIKDYPKVAHFIDRIKIETPIIGELILNMTISRFCYLLGTLIKSGLPLVNALAQVSKASGNIIIAGIIEKMESNARGGDDIFTPMRQSKYFSSMVIEMFVIGMESGQLDTMLIEIARHYDNVVEFQARKLTARIEPVLTVFVGGIVLMLALAIFMPMWNLIHVFKK
jgi:MSHA biogenesis protein MshG